MRKFLIWFCLTLTVLTLILLSLAGCGWICVPGDASEACIMQAVNATNQSANATATFGAQEWHIQQTLQAEEK
jgi:hypothetical protein